jgi:hypothetical protein
VKGEAEWILVIVVHHIASDAWSEDIFVRERTHTYNQFMAGLTPDLPVLAVQYADFAVWQRSLCDSSVYSQKINYWKQQLATAFPVRPQPDFQDITHKINSFAKAESLTM